MTSNTEGESIDELLQEGHDGMIAELKFSA